MTIARRGFIKTSAVTGAALMTSLKTGSRNAWAQTLLNSAAHPKFVNPLRLPARIDATGGGSFNINMKQTTQNLLGDGFPDTTVWGYGPGNSTTYPGPTFVAQRDQPVDVRWKNKLPKNHLLPVDGSVHWSNPRRWPRSGIPTVAHLHGGHTESASDGLPEAWYTKGWSERGPTFVKKTYRYDNSQEAATLWYHDHALGITRLNVYAGLAGFYLLRDDNENAHIAADVLPSGPHEIELVLQDRQFTESGQLFFPADNPDVAPGFPVPPTPSVIAEFFGDFNLVNGTTWPVLDVEPRPYRFRLLNGSDSRFYVLEFDDPGLTMLQIGTDDGLLPFPVRLTQLVIAPGERADIVVDFSDYDPGVAEAVTLLNFGPDEPFRGFNPDGTLSDGAGGVLPTADPATTGQVMQFVVGQALGSAGLATVKEGTRLRPDIAPLVQAGATRRLVLFEGLDNFGRLQPLLGTEAAGSLTWFEPITENPRLNDVEVWEVFNTTEDAHPIHLHLVAFRILNRESFTGTVTERPQAQHDGTFGVGGVLSNIVLGSDAVDPSPNEAGLKDTAVMLPGQVTRVIAKFDRPGRYVWHCHILSHEDHEMMRPYEIV